jgi:hypothetical protein
MRYRVRDVRPPPRAPAREKLVIDEIRDEPALFATLGGLGLLVMVAGTYVMVQDEGPEPPPPPPPPAIEKTAVRHIRFTEGYYRALLEEDAKRFGVAPFDVSQMLAPANYQAEFRGAQTLGKRPMMTNHLKIAVRSERVRVGTTESGFSVEHLVLRIENTSDKPIAYVVETKLTDPKGCSGKGDMGHNAIALKPHESIDRTECIYARWNELRVTRVDVMELTLLGYHYVSRLTPTQLGLDDRAGGGHLVPGGAQVCQHVPGREVREGLMRGTTRWQDVMDFYARHNCDEYWFFAGYRMREQPLEKLVPAMDESAAAPAPAAAPAGATR